MINSISGTITCKKVNEAHILTNGIEWSFTVSSISLDNLPSVGNETKIYAHLHHRQDVMQLFGFYNESERALFYDLLKVGGLGPKAVIKMLSGKKYTEIISSLENEDVNALTGIPGVGKKTAQKIVLQLKGKLTADEEFSNTEENHSFQDIVLSLADMGFDKKSAEKAVKDVVKSLDTSLLSRKQIESELMRKSIIALTGN